MGFEDCRVSLRSLFIAVGQPAAQRCLKRETMSWELNYSQVTRHFSFLCVANSGPPRFLVLYGFPSMPHARGALEVPAQPGQWRKSQQWTSQAEHWDRPWLCGQHGGKGREATRATFCGLYSAAAYKSLFKMSLLAVYPFDKERLTLPFLLGQLRWLSRLSL